MSYSYDIEVYDGLARRWIFAGNTRTLAGAKIYATDSSRPARATRIIEQPNGAIVWQSGV